MCRFISGANVAVNAHLALPLFFHGTPNRPCAALPGFS